MMLRKKLLKLWLGGMLICCALMPGVHADEHAMRIGANIWPGNEPLYLAKENQYFNANEIRIIDFLSAIEVIRAFRNNSLDAATLTLDEALKLIASKIPIEVIIVMDISDGADAIIAQADYSTFTDLKGKRIGVESNALGAYMLTRALNINQMQLNEIHPVHLPISDQESRFLHREVDAVVTFEPTRTRLLNQGAHQLFSSKEIPNEIVDVIVVRKSFASANPDKVRQLTNGWFKGLDFFNSQPQQASHLISKRLKIQPEEVLASYNGLQIPSLEKNYQLLRGNNPLLLPALSRLRDSLLQEHLIDQFIPTTGIVNGNYLP
ncbi:MAG: ABC transporter substrate-binding protein [Zetaproteobacteria bacterium]|nr:ABC transporter substrate-binding protein [Zetaproteobacteria bacterium]